MDLVNSDLSVPMRSTSIEVEGSYKDQFHYIFKDAIESYSDKYDAKTYFIEASELTSRTFDRYYSGLSAPTGKNILSAFAFILKERNLETVFELLPSFARVEFLKKYKSIEAITSINYSSLNLTSSQHKALYIRTMNGNTVNKNYFAIEQGKLKAESAIQHLLESKSVTELSNGLLSKGECRSNFSNQEILSLSKHIISEELSTKRLDDQIEGNRCDFHVHNLSEEGLTMAEAAKDIYIKALYEIEKTMSGNIILATTAATATLNNKELQ